MLAVPSVRNAIPTIRRQTDTDQTLTDWLGSHSNAAAAAKTPSRIHAYFGIGMSRECWTNCRRGYTRVNCQADHTSKQGEDEQIEAVERAERLVDDDDGSGDVRGQDHDVGDAEPERRPGQSGAACDSGQRDGSG